MLWLDDHYAPAEDKPRPRTYPDREHRDDAPAGWDWEILWDKLLADKPPRPASPITTALALSSFVASTVVVVGFIAWLIGG